MGRPVLLGRACASGPGTERLRPGYGGHHGSPVHGRGQHHGVRYGSRPLHAGWLWGRADRAGRDRLSHSRPDRVGHWHGGRSLRAYRRGHPGPGQRRPRALQWCGAAAEAAAGPASRTSWRAYRWLRGRRRLRRGTSLHPWGRVLRQRDWDRRRALCREVRQGNRMRPPG